MTRHGDRDRALAVVRDMRRFLRRFAFDVRHGAEEELLADAECALADLTRALGPLADLVEDMSGRRVIQRREAVFHPTPTPPEIEIVR